MIPEAFNGVPGYWNVHDRDKAYRRIGFISGETLQSAELNESSDILMSMMGVTNKHVVASGSMMEGCAVSKLTPTALQMEKGWIMVNGLPTYFNGGSVALLATELETIGVIIHEEKIDAEDDPTIVEKDPDSPYYQNQTSIREKVYCTLTSKRLADGNDTFTPIMMVKDGSIIQILSSVDQVNAIRSAIGNYDNLTFGSYVVNGLKLYLTGKTINFAADIEIYIGSGIGRVLGVENHILSEQIVAFTPISVFSSVAGEPLVYRTTNKGVIRTRNSPVKRVVRLLVVKGSTQTVVRGPTSGGQDTMAKTPVLKFDRVWSGSTTYVEGTDYEQDGDDIKWLSGAQPSPGATYNATFQYMVTVIPTVSLDGTITIALIDYTDMVHMSTVTIDYEYYLSRVDRVLMDASGAIVVQKGIPGPADLVRALPIPNGTLPLGTVTLAYGADPEINQDAVISRVTFAAQKSVAERLSNMEYNVARLSLLDSASRLDPTTNKRGITADPFFNDNLVDAGRAEALTVKVGGGTLTIATKWMRSIVAPVGAVLGSTDYEAISQTWITKDQRINPYAASDFPLAAVAKFLPESLTAIHTLSVTISMQNNERVWFDSVNHLANTGQIDKIREIAAVQSRVISLDASSENFSGINEDVGVTLNLSEFNAGEVIECTFRGAVFNRTADATGSSVTTLAVAKGTPKGSYVLTARGITSGARAAATLSVAVSTEVKIIPRVFWQFDPIAQTYFSPTTIDIGAVSVYVTELPLGDLSIEMCSVIAGQPNTVETFAAGRLKKSSVVLGWNKVYLDSPFTAQENTEYAIIVLVPSYEGKIATAKVGQRDNTKNKWLTNQAHDGVMLLSANKRTWTAVQDEDIAFIIHANNYSSTRIVKLMTIPDLAVGYTDLILSANAYAPQGTSIKYYLTRGLETIDLENNVMVNTEALPESSVAEPYELYAELTTTNSNLSPKVDPGTTLYFGIKSPNAAYVSREWVVFGGLNNPADIQVVAEVYEPFGCRIDAYYMDDVGAWVQIPRKSTVPYTQQLNTAVWETVSKLTLAKTRLKLDLVTNSDINRPIAVNLRTLVI